MCRSARSVFLGIAILVAGGLSCNRSAPITKQPPAASSQPQLVEQAKGLDPGTEDSRTPDPTTSADEPETAPKTNADAPTAGPTQTIDAEVVLKDALALAADEKKLLLVHIGAPG